MLQQKQTVPCNRLEQAPRTAGQSLCWYGHYAQSRSYLSWQHLPSSMRSIPLAPHPGQTSQGDEVKQRNVGVKTLLDIFPVKLYTSGSDPEKDKPERCYWSKLLHTEFWLVITWHSDQLLHSSPHGGRHRQLHKRLHLEMIKIRTKNSYFLQTLRWSISESQSEVFSARGSWPYSDKLPTLT